MKNRGRGGEPFLKKGFSSPPPDPHPSSSQDFRHYRIPDGGFSYCLGDVFVLDVVGEAEHVVRCSLFRYSKRPDEKVPRKMFPGDFLYGMNSASSRLGKSLKRKGGRGNVRMPPFWRTFSLPVVIPAFLQARQCGTRRPPSAGGRRSAPRRGRRCAWPWR